MAKIKLIAGLILAGAAFIIVLQNTQPVETRLLFTTVTMSRAALLTATMFIGIFIGILLAISIGGKKSKKE